MLKTLTRIASLIVAAPLIGGEMTKAPVIEDPACTVPFYGSVSLGYEQVYLFRGVDFGQHAPWAGVDLNYDISDTLSLNFGTWYINPTQNPVDSDELDVYAFLNFPLGVFDASVGATWFYFAEADAEATEGFFGLSYSVGDLVDIGAFTAYDESTDGWYYEVNASKGIPLTECIELGLSTGVSYGDNYFGVSSFNHAYATAGITWAMTETAAFDLYVGGNYPLEDLEELGEDDDVYGGASVTVSF